MAHQRGGGEVKRPALHADHREQRRAAHRQEQVAQVPRQRPYGRPHQRQRTGEREADEDREAVDDPAHRHPAGVEPQPVHAVDAPLEIEHGAVGADLDAHARNPVLMSGIAAKFTVTSEMAREHAAR